MIERRSPDVVMTLERLGSLHQSRLSFMRQLTRRIAREGWSFHTHAFNIDANGVGHAVYTAKGPERSYSLVAFAHDLPPELRSDRVIATAWDATFTLFDGVPTVADIERLSQNIPLQEAGRVSESELTVSRANRSVRLWDHCVEALASGNQPDPAQLDAVGYLMRTTAVYGSGKLGAADREVIANRPEMQAPFQAEMLTVYLIRWFVRDLIEHIARSKGGEAAVKLDRDIAVRLGIGNSTGLGMAPFIVNHPVLFNNWIMAREEAIARVRSVERASPDEIACFNDLVARAERSVQAWNSEHPWDALWNWAENHLTSEGQEWLASLMLEPYGELVDGLGTCMADSHTQANIVDGSMPVSELLSLIEQSFGWALDVDWNAPEHTAMAWYVSEEKLEPRLGNRFEEPIAAYEQPLAPARDAADAYRKAQAFGRDETTADFLTRHPDCRHTVRRAQMARFAPYAEIRSNTIAHDILPINMLRAKLSFFGVTHFDPRSDRWVRVCMYAGAPYPTELSAQNCEHWIYPEAAL